MLTRLFLVLLTLLTTFTLPSAAVGATLERIAFVSDRDGNDEIYTAEPNGNDPRRLTANTVADSAPAWSPGMTKIAFARGLDIWVMNADGTDQRAITGLEGVDSEPTWSPDGTRIAFVSIRNTPDGYTTGREIWVMGADGSGVRRVTDTDPGDSRAPAWSPVGDRIAFHSNLDGEFEIYTIAADSTPPGTGTDTRVKLTSNVGIQDQNPSWSPDGARIAFERGSGTNVGDPTKEIWVMDADGSDQSQLTTNSVYDVQPTWSPDGTRIAYESNADGDLEVVAMPSGGGAAANVTSTGAGIADGQPAWGGAPAPIEEEPPPTTDPTPTPDPTPTTDQPKTTPPTQTPVIFIHGFLGASIECDAPVGRDLQTGEMHTRVQELWPNLYPVTRPSPGISAPSFDQMRLGSDGISNLQNGDGCTQSARVRGLVRTALGSDVYDGTIRNLEGLGRPYYVYTYDWRQSPQRALVALDALVERARRETGAPKVALFSHSMGGLVTRWYIDAPDRAGKVERALTVGTPYWGSAKGWLPLVRGFESQGFARFNPLDTLVHNPDSMKRWAQNLTGLFFLYPSSSWYENKGPWLSFEGEYDGRWLPFSGVISAIASQNGNITLARQAHGGHRDYLDGFKTNGVDYRIVVGTGVETVTKMREHRKAWIPYTDYTFGDGDGTVPSFSGFQQINAQSAVLGENIPRHYVCGLDHNALATDAGLFAGVAGFLRDGSEITLRRASSNGEPDQRGLCGRSKSGGREIVIHADGGRGPAVAEDVDIAVRPGPRQDVTPGRARAAQAGSASMKLHEAARAGLVEVLERGERTVIVARAEHPSSLLVSGRGLAVQITALGDETKGRTVAYKTKRGTMVISGTSAAVNGKRLKASRLDRTPPRTTVNIRRRGRTAVLTARARDRSGVRATFIQIGSGKRREWSGARRVPTRKLRSVRFGSVDVFGNAEPPRRVRR